MGTPRILIKLSINHIPSRYRITIWCLQIFLPMVSKTTTSVPHTNIRVVPRENHLCRLLAWSELPKKRWVSKIFLRWLAMRASLVTPKICSVCLLGNSFRTTRVVRLGVGNWIWSSNRWPSWVAAKTQKQQIGAMKSIRIYMARASPAPLEQPRKKFSRVTVMI